MDRATSYDVRIYKTEIYQGAKVTTYYVRWRVHGRQRKEPFRTASQADSFRSELLTAARKGEPFSIETGLPIVWKRGSPEERGQSWYQFVSSYTAAKWPYASPNHRHRRGLDRCHRDAALARCRRAAS